MKQTVLVCGGRDYHDRDRIFFVLDLTHAANPIGYLIHGCASGADKMAETWAIQNRVPVERYPALWEEHGRRAGPIRNQLMLDDGKPDLVIAFPGGAGTADMVRRANVAGVPIVTISKRRE
jgi:hypothetical protein